MKRDKNSSNEIEADLEVLLASTADDHPDWVYILNRFPSAEHVEAFMNRLKENKKGRVTVESTTRGVVTTWSVLD